MSQSCPDAPASRPLSPPAGFSLLRLLAILAAPALLSAVVSHAQVSENVILLGAMNHYPSAGYNDCWGYTAPDGREYALLGVRTGTSIVDITDAPVLREVVFIPGPPSVWKDIKTYRQYAYVVNESSGGIQIIDLSGLPATATLAGSYTGLSASHNISIDTARAMLYAEGEGNQYVRAISLADPLTPVQVSAFGVSSHDMYAQDGTVYVAEGSYGSVGIFDLSMPAAPLLRARFTIPFPGYVHNVWTTLDRRYLMSTEETNGRSVKLWDIGNPDSVVMTDEYFASPFLAHNTHLLGSYAYISYYSDGLRIVDISDPYNMTEAGYYDTYQGPGGGFDGAWGAFPFFPSGKILISDIQTGLYVVRFERPDQLDPRPVTGLAAYSDFSTPTAITLTWIDPSQRVDGSAILPSDLLIEIRRDGLLRGVVPGGVGGFVDTGLVDGREYTYLVNARLLASDSISQTARAGWTAGGSPVPSPPAGFRVAGTASRIRFTWTNPSRNVDGTPMDDLAGIQLLENGVPVAVFTRTVADTGRVDSILHDPGDPGPRTWALRVVDSETPPNISAATPGVTSPLLLPVRDLFSSQGVPDPFIWSQTSAFVDNRARNAPTPPYALNLDGRPSGGDIIDMRPINTSGLDQSGLTLQFQLQPQGNGDAPEPEDSLLVYFRNSLGQWVQAAGYPGEPVRPFTSVAIPVASVPAGGGSFFHEEFQVRFRSRGERVVGGFSDDWFVDDLVLSFATAAVEEQSLPDRPVLLPNFPNPFNPATTIRFLLPAAGRAALGVFDLLGREVRTLLNGDLPAGSHAVSFDATGLASGVYFYRLSGPGFTHTRSMMIAK